ncbi:LytTR family transcriptional regulator [Aquabacterium sp. OR-4]|uniref:LytTR family transcriptional regulator n=1 Tax=Aquabacterium sp. OR-4 TaxID=2978127 RepID=UPI0021B1A181|nr:PAS domain-containing transcriptional regulator [Aquabacterium sp. OR-4]MDT7835726.1 LytTR family transcriptional regulator DNA-binding domain-containing protein [Aquabacterium sp. OR-4]
MDSHAVSPLYLLERFDVGIVHLDGHRRVVGMNDFARRVLPVDRMLPFDQMVLDFHPSRSRPKVEFLLDQAAQCPVAAPPPMTMIINIPERVLLIKVSRLSGGDLRPGGYTLVFYDITDLVAAKDDASPRAAATPAAQAAAELPGQLPVTPPAQRRRLLKVPTVSQQRILFVDADDIVAIGSDGHYTRVLTAGGSQFCNLSIGDLETRLDPELFMRVHRSHVINLRAVRQLQRDDGRLAVQLSGVAEPVPVSRGSAGELLERLGVPAGSLALPNRG